MRNLEKDLRDLFGDGAETVHVLADFDGTLTKEYVDGKKTSSIIAVLRNEPGYLPPEYAPKAHEMYDHYSKIEKDLSLDLEYRKQQMSEWWQKHHELLIASGLRLEHLARVSKSDFIQFREGAEDLLHLLRVMNVPVVILSAAGIGEVIQLYCRERHVDSENMHYIINKYYWDPYGHSIGYHKPVIHSLNKDETVFEQFPEIAKAVAGRPNVLLLGNSIGDLGMAKGADYQKLLTIGFLDQEECARRSEYEQHYDHVIVGEDYRQILEIINNL